jgi:hypothetical protein
MSRVFSPINLANAELLIDKNLTINGPGANRLTVQHGGNSAFRVFEIAQSNINVTISGLTIANGNGPGSGGGILNQSNGTLTVTGCTISGNRATNSNGGGIFNNSFCTLTVTGCTISGNSAGDSFGGGIFNLGMLTVTNSTISGNSSPGNGGGIDNFSVPNQVSTATITNSTISGNFANSNGGGIDNFTVIVPMQPISIGTVNLTNCTISGNRLSVGGGGSGGGIYNFSGNTVNAKNTIIATNTAPSSGPDFNGTLTSQGFNFIGNSSGAFITPVQINDKIGTAGSPKDPLLGPLQSNGGPTQTEALLSGSTAINTGDPNASPRDQRGYVRQNAPDIGAFEFGGIIPVTLANISTRLLVQTGDNVLIGGFIITGTQQKKVILRAIGPSLTVPGKLADPTMELHNGAGQLIASNDNWMDAPNKQAIIDSSIPPSNNLESAILMSLNPGAYTAIVRGVNNGTGIGVVEAYDLDRTVDSKLANISTRGAVQTGDNVLIGGFIVLGPDSQKVIIRALGPSVPVPGNLADPTLELHDSNGALLEANDNWMDSPNKQAIIDSTIPPNNPLESAIVRTLTPANYTAIVRGVNNSTGIAVVEVYALN